MKKTLLLLATVFLFARCNNHQEETPATELVFNDNFTENLMAPFTAAPTGAQGFYLQVEPKEESLPRTQLPAIRQLLAAQRSQPQRFTIYATEHNELQGEYGTRVSIDEKSFVTESGAEISAPIDIELKECYTKDEMLQENLTTTSSNKLLETKGAVYVSAKCNGEAVRLKEGEHIKIQFPFGMDGGYGFYYGERGADNINWVPASNTEEGGETAVKPRISKPEFNYKGYNLNDYLLSQLEYPEDAKRNEPSANVDATFTIDKNGKMVDVSCMSSYKTFRDEIIYTLQQMPRWKPAMYGKKKISSHVKVSIDFNLRRKTQIVVAFNSDDVIPLIVDKTKTDTETTATTSTGFFERMGWINCSRVTDLNGPKADVVVRSDASTDVKLVYRNKMTIASGDNFVGFSRFTNLPIGAEVFVVAVRSENGEKFYSVESLKLEKQTVVSLNWKKGDKADIEKLYKGVS